jgi:hypothetical protein
MPTLPFVLPLFLSLVTGTDRYQRLVGCSLGPDELVSFMALACVASAIPSEIDVARAARRDLPVTGPSFLRIMLALVQHRLRNGNTRFIVASLSDGLMGSHCQASRTLDEACRPALGNGMATPSISLQTATVTPDREWFSLSRESMG